jgi:RNA polymerase I-specific transcription initiation factor RRN6
MTDHRVTDLSYGHLGKATYDLEENVWNFTVDTTKGML